MAQLDLTQFKKAQAEDKATAEPKAKKSKKPKRGGGLKAALMQKGMC